MKTLVQDTQAPLRSLYRATPALAMVTDHARTCGGDPADPFHSSVEPMDGCGVVASVGVHRAVGGLHDAPTPGDLPVCRAGSLQDSAVRMVANRLGVEILALKVCVTAQVDVRGALGMDPEVPVGFQVMTCDIHLQVVDHRTREVLNRQRSDAAWCGERCGCPPPVVTRFVDAGTFPADNPLWGFIRREDPLTKPIPFAREAGNGPSVVCLSLQRQ